MNEDTKHESSRKMKKAEVIVDNLCFIKSKRTFKREKKEERKTHSCERMNSSLDKIMSMPILIEKKTKSCTSELIPSVRKHWCMMSNHDVYSRKGERRTKEQG